MRTTKPSPTRGTRDLCLTGREAIAFARKHGLLLCKYADPTEDVRDDFTPDHAAAVAREDPSLIYLQVPAEML